MFLAGINENSLVDGKGIRLVLFFQGCPHNCKGCHNPQTHEYSENVLKYSVKDILDLVDKNPLVSGITYSGGEPISERNFEELLELSKALKKKKTNFSIWCFTGYTIEDAFIKYPDFLTDFSKYVDVFIDGPFVQEKRDISLPFRGSSNQRLLRPMHF